MEVLGLQSVEILKMQNEFLAFSMQKGFKPEETIFALMSLSLKILEEHRKDVDKDEAAFLMFDLAVDYNEWLKENDPLNGPMGGTA